VSSRTEQILAALHAALGAAAAAEGAAVTGVTRNEALADQLAALGAGTAGHLNLVDGSSQILSTLLGAPPTYEIEHSAEIEWIVQAATQPARDAAFDAGLNAIADTVDSVAAAIEDGDAPFAGLLDAIEIGGIERSNLAIEGVPQLKGAIVTVKLTFTSSRPF
jgi:hypothetical protein